MKSDKPRRVVGWAIVVLLLGVVLAGCTTVVAPAETAADAMPAMALEPGKITVMNARSRPSPMAGGNGAAIAALLDDLKSSGRSFRDARSNLSPSRGCPSLPSAYPSRAQRSACTGPGMQ